MKNTSINLLFIVNSAGIGGAERHVVALLNELEPARFTISFAYLKNEDDLLPEIDRGRVRGAIFCCHVSSKIDWGAARRLAQTIKEEAIDIVVCINTYPLLYGSIARIMSGRDTLLVDIFHSTEPGSVKEQMEMLFYRPLLHVCDMLVYVCENQRRYWRSRVLKARQDTVIHNGVDLAHFTDRYSQSEKNLFRKKYGFSSTDYLIGLCAYMRPEKAHGDLLEAIFKLRAAGLTVKCLFIGDGPERAKIEAKIRLLGLGAHVAITGLINDVRPAIAMCDVIVLASHHVETFSIAALESMALGKPMIMTDIGGASEQVIDGTNGFLYDRGDIGALVNGLHQLSDPTRRKQMGDRARSMMAEQFSLAGMVTTYERLFVALNRSHGAKQGAVYGE